MFHRKVKLRCLEIPGIKTNAFTSGDACNHFKALNSVCLYQRIKGVFQRFELMKTCSACNLDKVSMRAYAILLPPFILQRYLSKLHSSVASRFSSERKTETAHSPILNRHEHVNNGRKTLYFPWVEIKLLMFKMHGLFRIKCMAEISDKNFMSCRNWMGYSAVFEVLNFSHC